MSPSAVRHAVAQSATVRRQLRATSEPGSAWTQRSEPRIGYCTVAESKEECWKLKIYVGNLPFETTDEDLAQEFSAFGEVASANVVIDRVNGRSRGFGFVEMPTDSEAEAAIAALNGKELMGRPLTVNESRPREDSGGFRGGRGGGGGGGGGYRGGSGGGRRY